MSKSCQELIYECQKRSLTIPSSQGCVTLSCVHVCMYVLDGGFPYNTYVIITSSISEDPPECWQPCQELYRRQSSKKKKGFLY